MKEEAFFKIGPYEVDPARFYDAATHLWVAPTGAGRVRCGFDPLGADTCGDIVAVSFEPVGTAVDRGQALGYVEAAKFVGPLLAPVAGVVRAHNSEPLADPALLNRTPLTAWLVELESSTLAADLARLFTGRAALEPWFRSELEKFERQGMIAE